MNEKKEKMKTEEPGRGAVTFRILFIVLWVLAIALGIAMFFLPRYSSRIGASGFTQFCASVATSISSHLHTLFLFNTTYRSRSVHQTGALEFACLVLVGNHAGLLYLQAGRPDGLCQTGS
jgi:flagellar basal body-associated protein FliL